MLGSKGRLLGRLVKFRESCSGDVILLQYDILGPSLIDGNLNVLKLDPSKHADGVYPRF